MLVDEVLAVGDAAFAQKVHGRLPCPPPRGQDARTRHPRHVDGREPVRPGDADRRRRAAVPRRSRGDGAALLPCSTSPAHGSAPAPAGGVWDVNVTLVDAWLESPAGERVDERRAGRTYPRSRMRARGAARLEPRSSPSTSSTPTGSGLRLQPHADARRGEPDRRRGRARPVAGEIENRLVPGRYFVHCYVARSREHGDIAMHRLRLL